GKFDDNTIDVEGKMSSDSRGLLETYAQGAQDADKMLQSLVEHYSQSDEPTILVFFGDHLPYLEDDYMVYRDTGYLKADDPDFVTKTHDTPFVIWSNYLNAPRESLHISPVHLSPYVLHLAGIPGTAYTDFLYNLSKKYPLLPAEEDDESLGIVPDDDLTKLQEIEDDILFGQQAIYGADKDRIIADNFVMGYGPPKIERISVLDGKVLRVEGGRYGQGCVIYVNDMPLKTKWQSETTLIAALPSNLIVKKGQSAEMQVEVRVIDENKDELGRSEMVSFQQ
ncbi:MAG: sulfatase, partial [Paenibacillaceae bacterium]|nr:sulfatase [Paenibacillaceae bacterium]